MDQTLAVTAETVAAMPSTELVGAWVLLTRAIAEQALADPETLAPCSGDALPRTFDERHTRARSRSKHNWKTSPLLRRR